MLDAIAHNNLVLVRDVFTGTLMNERAIEQSREVWKDYPEFQDCLAGREGPGVSGAGPCGKGNFLGAMRWAFPDVRASVRRSGSQRPDGDAMALWLGLGPPITQRTVHPQLCQRHGGARFRLFLVWGGFQC